MFTNKNLLSKSKIMKMVSLPTISLAAEEADRFIDYVVDESVMKNNARIIRMDKETKNVRALGLGSARFLKPASTFSSSDYKKTFTDNLIALAAKKLRGCVVIYDDDLEDGIEGDAFVDHLMRMITKQIANELDEIYFIGDTHSLSGFASTDARSIMDGWRYRLDHSQSGETYENDVSGSAILLDASNTITGKAGSFSITTSQGIAEQDSSAPYNWEFKYDLMLQKLPSKYKVGGLDKLRFFNNDQITQNYIKALGARSTVLGDAALLGTASPSYGKVPIISCPLMPTTMKIDTVDAQKEAYIPASGTLTDCILTHRDNFIIGIHRDIKIEGQREAADEAMYYFYSMRVDVAIENVNAAVILKRLKVV